jgi:hypothetical protein
MLGHVCVPILSTTNNYTFSYLSILELMILFTSTSDEMMDICSELK